MRIALLSLTAAALVTASSAFADDKYDQCIDTSDGTNASYGACGGDWIKRADTALNEAWAELKEQADEEVFKDLLDEQRAWNAYKEKSCMFLAGGWFGREGQTISYPGCRAEVIEARTESLYGLMVYFQRGDPDGQ